MDQETGYCSWNHRITAQIKTDLKMESRTRLQAGNFHTPQGLDPSKQWRVPRIPLRYRSPCADLRSLSKLDSPVLIFRAAPSASIAAGSSEGLLESCSKFDAQTLREDSSMGRGKILEQP